MDVIATHFEVLPMYTQTILSTEPDDFDIDFTFSFDVVKGTGVNLLSHTFSYKLVISPSMDPFHPLAAEIADTVTPGQSFSVTTVSGEFT